MPTSSPPAPAVASPVSPRERVEVLDALRGMALFGIFVANLGYFTGWYFMSPEAKACVPLAGTNDGTSALHYLLVHGKFYTVFSLLFGIGFALQLTRAEGRGDPGFLRLYARRLAVLLGIGLVHLCLIWDGDILALYALCGFLLLPFRRCADRTLLVWAAVLILLPVLHAAARWLSGGAYDPGGPLNAFGDRLWASFGYAEGSEVAVIGRGGWQDFLQWVATGPFYRYGFLLTEGRPPKVLAVFLLGLWAGRRLMAGRLLGDTRLLRGVLTVGLVVGLPANAAMVVLFARGGEEAASALGVYTAVAYALGVAPLGLAYAAGVALLWRQQAEQRILGWLAPAGRLALTNYLGQSLVGIALFYGVGLGLMGHVGPLAWTGLAVVVFAMQTALSEWCLRHFRFGPAEWLWRRLAYGGPLPLRLPASSAPVLP